jgi:chemotaxis protein histidine kinase CheA
MVNAGRLFELMNLIAELRLEAETMANRVQRTLANPDTSRAGARRSVDAVRAMTESLQVQALAMSSTSFHHLTSQLPQVANYLAGKLSRQVQLEVVADEDLAVDRAVIDHLTEAVRQLVVNAVYHGIEDPSDRARADKPEMGTVTVTATLKDRMLDITVSDDGAGIDWDLVRSIAIEDGRLQGEAPMQAVRNVVFEAGFSTQTGGDAVGEGMGLETVARAVESLYGRVVIESTVGRGTQVRITVPAWRSLQRLLVVDAGGVGWGIPEAAVDEVMPYADVVVGDESSDVSIPWRGERIAVRPLGTMMGAEAAVHPSHVVVLRHRLGSTALAVDLIEGVREVAVKELSPVVSSPDHVTGAAFLGGDDVVLVLEPGSLVAGSSISASDRPAPRVLVVDDSMGARAVVSGSLASSGFTTSVAASVAEALEVLEHIELDALVVDYSMPGTDGVALVREVRERYAGLPIVMLSGVADEADRERARTAGVNAFFDKGAFREGELSDALWDMVGGQ